MKLLVIIAKAAAPAAVPDDHSVGCNRVAAFAKKLWAIDFPGISKFSAYSEVNALNGM